MEGTEGQAERGGERVVERAALFNWSLLISWIFVCIITSFVCLHLHLWITYVLGVWGGGVVCKGELCSYYSKFDPASDCKEEIKHLLLLYSTSFSLFKIIALFYFSICSSNFSSGSGAIVKQCYLYIYSLASLTCCHVITIISVAL